METKGADRSEERVRHERVSKLFLRAQLLRESERFALLSRECGDDISLRDEVQALLEEADGEGPLQSGRHAGLLIPGGGDVIFPSLEAGATFEDFELIELLGTGGMGEVWRAHKSSTDGSVALKVVGVGRVDREARSAGKLRHPGIVQVHQTGATDRFAWISMEYVEGGRTLRDFVRESREARQLPEDYDRRVAEMIAKIAVVKTSTPERAHVDSAAMEPGDERHGDEPIKHHPGTE